MKAAAWRAERGSTHYRLQISDIQGKRNFNRLRKEMTADGWDIYGDGFGKKGKEFLLLVRRKFPTEEKWLEWARNSNFNMVEYNHKGKPKRTKLGTNYKPRRVG